MVLIYSKGVDDFVNNVLDWLDIDFIRIGSRDVIAIDKIIINDEKDFKINTPFSKKINLKNINTIWFNGGSIKIEGNAYENECYSSLIDSYLNYIPVRKIGRLYNEFEVNKLDASLEAQNQGFKTPNTLITCKKKDLKTFYKRYAQGVICKRITDTIYYENEGYIHDFGLTFSITNEVLSKTPEYFALTLFQEKVIADFEIRVIYIRGECYSMAIHVFDDKVDYRTKLTSLVNIRTVPFKLPKKIEKSLKKVFENLNLNYGSADLMYSNDEFYFLEINPTGQISFVNNACNFYLEKKLSDILKNEK